jgi:hypothetical protein
LFSKNIFAAPQAVGGIPGAETMWRVLRVKKFTRVAIGDHATRTAIRAVAR